MKEFKENRKKSNEEFSRELGLGILLIIGILIAFPLFIFSIPFYILFRFIKKKKLHLIISVVSLFILIFGLFYDWVDYLGVYSVLPIDVSFLEKILKVELNFTKITLMINISGGLFLSYVWSLVTDYVRSKKVLSKEEKNNQIRESDHYKKVYNNRFKLNNSIQKKWRKDVLSGKTNKLLLGINQLGEPYYIDFKEINQHMFVPATTGGGKTVFMLGLIEYSLMKNYPFLFIDGKGSLESIEEVKQLCDMYDKELKVFSDTSSLTYNPLKHGNSTVITDKLQHLVETESQYYVKVNELLVQTLIQFLDEYGLKRDMWEFAKYLDPEEIKKVLNSDVKKVDVNSETVKEGNEIEETIYSSFLGGEDNEETLTKENSKTNVKLERTERSNRFYYRFFDRWESSEEGKMYLFKHASTVRMAMYSLIDSELGVLFKDKKDGLDLISISENNEGLFISLDGTIYDRYIKQIARFIISDINYLVSYRNKNKMKDYPFLVVYDEFSVYANSDIVDTVNKSRSAGFHCVIATQTLSDLDKVDSSLKNQIVGNTNTYVIGQTNNPDEVEKWSDMFGTFKDIDLTQVTEEQKGNVNRLNKTTGVGTVRDVEKYKINPNHIRDLRQGGFVVYRKASEEFQEPEIIYSRHPLS